MTTNSIDFHDGHAAINVKYRASLYDPQVPDDVASRAWDQMVETWWEQAQTIAHEHGYSGVFSEGRSGGWCVPYCQRTHGKLQQFTQWPGQGPQHGYPDYPDVSDSKQRKQFLAFKRDICKLLADVPQMYKAIVKEAL